MPTRRFGAVCGLWAVGVGRGIAGSGGWWDLGDSGRRGGVGAGPGRDGRPRHPLGAYEERKKRGNYFLGAAGSRGRGRRGGPV